MFSAAFKGAGQGAVYCARPGKVDPPKIMTFFLQFYQKISRREFLSENFYCARQEKVNPPKIMTMVQYSTEICTIQWPEKVNGQQTL